MSDTPSNAVFLVAAISVIIFSVVGVGVMTGHIPSLAPQGESKTGRGTAPGPTIRQLCADCARIEQVRLLRAAQTASAGFEDQPQPAELQRYEVVARLANGSARVFSYAVQPEFRVGDTVRIEGESLRNH